MLTGRMKGNSNNSLMNVQKEKELRVKLEKLKSRVEKSMTNIDF